MMSIKNLLISFKKDRILRFCKLLVCSLTIVACNPSGEKTLYNGNSNLVRLSKPRIQPVDMNKLDDAQKAYLEPHERAGRLFNVFKTAAQHPKAAGKFDTFAFYTNSESTLSSRHREMIILRIGWLCQSEYEWAVHSRVALTSGLNSEEILQITKGPDEPGWTSFESNLLQAVDELHKDAFITNKTWKSLSKEFNEQQLIDLVFTVGAYNTVSMFLNSLGVQLDENEGLTGFPNGN